MRNLKLIVFFFLTTFISCGDDPFSSFQDEATITGLDARLCPCCGGYFIRIQDVEYRFYFLPDGSEFVLLHEPEFFPIEVYLNWRISATSCLGDEIEILEIEKK